MTVSHHADPGRRKTQQRRSPLDGGTGLRYHACMSRIAIALATAALSLVAAAPALAHSDGVPQQPIASTKVVGKKTIKVAVENPTAVRLIARFCSDYTVTTRKRVRYARVSRVVTVTRTRTACEDRNLAPLEQTTFRMTGRSAVEVELL